MKIIKDVKKPLVFMVHKKDIFSCMKVFIKGEKYVSYWMDQIDNALDHTHLDTLEEAGYYKCFKQVTKPVPKINIKEFYDEEIPLYEVIYFFCICIEK